MQQQLTEENKILNIKAQIKAGTILFPSLDGKGADSCWGWGKKKIKKSVLSESLVHFYSVTATMRTIKAHLSEDICWL